MGCPSEIRTVGNYAIIILCENYVRAIQWYRDSYRNQSTCMGYFYVVSYFTFPAADFGLAKQKQRDLSVMKSVVGTVLYWW